MYLVAALALASAAIAAPVAESACTKAAKDLTFQIRDFTFNSKAIYSTPAHLATSEGAVDFDFAVSAKKNSIHCSATTVSTYPNYFDGTTWYECAASETFSASFKYDLDTGLVKLKAHWNCPE
jgi:polyisoprenoid-binding protein YceI